MESGEWRVRRDAFSILLQFGPSCVLYAPLLQLSIKIGVIEDFDRLRQTLLAAGHRFESAADSE